MNPQHDNKKAVVLLSGGMDSATTLAIAADQGYEVYALSFRYGQRHSAELGAAMNLARMFGAAEHKVVDLDLSSIGGSALTDMDIDVPTEPGALALFPSWCTQDQPPWTASLHAGSVVGEKHQIRR